MWWVRRDGARSADRRGRGGSGGGAIPARMTQKTRKPEVEIEVDGQPYVWRIQRQPQWSSDTAGWRGMAITVRHGEGQREAVLEFPPAPPPRRGTPLIQPSQIPPQVVARAIASAVAAGWEPLSRGKTVAIVVDETGG